MKRGIVLGALVAAGALSTGVAAWQRGAQGGQQTITVDRVRDNLYVFRGGGGNTAVFVTSSGVVVVDAKNPGWGQPILDRIRDITPQPVTTLINTHTHGDHVGGNPDFPATVDIVVHERTRAHMQRMEAFAGGRGMATRSFADRLTIGTGDDRVDLHYFGPGHTDGDAWVVFPSLRAAHTGDIFATKGLPLVDGSNGGSVLRYAETLRRAHAGITDVDTVINGHHPVTTTWDDLRVFAEFNQEFLEWAQSELRAGKTPEDAAAGWKLPARYQDLGYSPNVSNLFGGLPGRLTLLAEEMRRELAGR